MKKFPIIITFVFIAFSVIAQSNIRLNNYWGNMHFINPASIYDKYEAVFTIAAREQWYGINGAPTTFLASGSTYLEKYKTQFGLSLLQDKAGYTTTTNVNLSYAYEIPIQEFWQLNLGLAGNYQTQLFDISQIKIIDKDDSFVYPEFLPKRAWNADVGVELSNPYFKIGAVTQNLISTFDSVQFQPNTNFVYARFYQNSNNIFNLGGGICGIQYANIYQAEFNLTGYFKTRQSYGSVNKIDLFDLGVFYRTQSELGLIFGINLSESLRVTYSYDYHFGSIRFNSFGTNELVLTYNLRRRTACKNCWY